MQHVKAPDGDTRPKKTAVLIMTHFWNQAVEDLFNRIRAERPESYDVFVIYDTASGPLQAPAETAFLKDALHLCNHAKLIALGYPEKTKPEGWTGKGWETIHNADTLVLSFYRDHPEYAYYWGIEYDVHFEGKWGFFFERFEASTADLLGTMLDSATKVPRLVLNPPFHDPQGKKPDYADAIMGFFPIHRVSNRFLKAVDQDYLAGWNGHYEFMWGTTAKRHGMEIEDIGGNGPYVKPHNINTFYFNTIGRWDNAPGTFIFRPTFTKVLKRENTLWHPVKPGGNYLNHYATHHQHGLFNRIKYLAKCALYGLTVQLWFRLRWRPAASHPAPTLEKSAL
jgi:hypothetical protein